MKFDLVEKAVRIKTKTSLERSCGEKLSLPRNKKRMKRSNQKGMPWC